MEYFDGTICFLYTMVRLNRSPPNGTIHFLYAMVPGAELSIPAPQAFLGRGDASTSDTSEGIGRLRRGMGM